MNDRWERFFVWCWRINGIVLLAVGVLALFGLSVFVVGVTGLWPNSRPEQQLTKVGTTDVAAKHLSLGDFEEISGTDYLIARLAEFSEYGGFSSSGSSARSVAHNLLFFNASTKKAHWLLPEGEETIPSFSILTDPPTPRYGSYGDRQTERVALGLLVEIQAQGAMGAAQAQRRLAIASADGRGVKTIAPSIDALLGYHQIGKESVLVFYVSKGAAKVLDYDLVTGGVRSDEALSPQS